MTQITKHQERRDHSRQTPGPIDSDAGARSADALTDTVRSSSINGLWGFLRT